MTAEYFHLIAVCCLACTALTLTMTSLSLCLSLSVLISSVRCQDCWETNQERHQVTMAPPLPFKIFDILFPQPALPPPRIVHYLAHCLGADDPLESVLTPLLTPRVVETEGHSQARLYISQVLTELGWSLELDSFSQDTVIGERTFTNIIATRNKNSPRRLGKQHN